MQGKRTHEEAFKEENKEEVMKEGSKVYIYKGQHKGLLGTVTKMFKFQEAGLSGVTDNDDKTELIIELDINKSEVRLKKSRVILASKRAELLKKGIIKEEASDMSCSDSDIDNSSSDSDSDSNDKSKKKEK